MSVYWKYKIYRVFVLQKVIFLTLVLIFICAISELCLSDEYEAEWEEVSSSIPKSGFTSDQEFKNRIKARQLEREQAKAADKIQGTSTKRVRKFHEVLDELLAEFSYDIRMGQINGLKNIAIRKVDISETLPSSYKNYVELLIEERIRENSRVRLLTCTVCKTKTSQLIDGKLVVLSPTTSVEQMRKAAQDLGIDNFLDVVLVYHTTHMVLGIQIFNSATQEMMWARTYNSETVKSRYQKLAVDYSQIAKSRVGEDYKPEYRFVVGFGGGVVPNLNSKRSDDSVLVLHLRASEKFDNRKQEFGLGASIYLRKNSIFKQYYEEGSANFINLLADTSVIPAPFNNALNFYAFYGRNILRALESYNEIRHGLNVGIGGILASSAYLAASSRVGWDIYFGRRFITNFAFIYIAPSQVLISNEYVKVKGGIGGELTLSINL